jgi:arylsulfatase A-like enzyme
MNGRILLCVSPTRTMALVLVDFLAAVGAVGTLGTMTLGSACRSRPASEPPLNVLLVTLDTTRADALGAYGGKAVTPSLDHLAAEGIVFDQASTVAPLTLPAHASLFTGLFPPSHGLHGNGQNALGTESITLAEQLKARGFRTGAFVSSFVLDHRWGLDRGFDVYHDPGIGPGQRIDRESLRRSADSVVDDALDWMQQLGDDRFFAWLHFYDAHAPARPPAEFAPIGAEDDYFAAIGFVDFQLSRVLTFLVEHQLVDRTIVVVIGDHGESLGEHGEPTHGLFVYEGVLHVPFIISAPLANMQGRRVSEPVRIVDVMPTVLDLLGQSAAPAIDGETLVPLMTGAARALRLDVYSESRYGLDRFGWSPLSALREGRFKMILAPRPELYDLEADTHESVNLYQRRADLAASMTRRLRTLAQPVPSRQASSASLPVDAETRARLAALGYIASAPAPGDPVQTLADPKDRIDLYKQLTRFSRRQGGLP